MIRVELPTHLRRLANVEGELALDIVGPVDAVGVAGPEGLVEKHHAFVPVIGWTHWNSQNIF